MIGRTRMLVALFGLALAACGQTEPADTIVTQVDSAGVTLVSNTGHDRALAVSLSREFKLGGQPDGPESFYRLYPQQVSISARGLIAVLNRQAYQVSVFDPDGEFLVSVGREGEGPGELSDPASLAVRPDGEIMVYDYRKRTLVRFASDGTVLDEQRLSVPFNGAGMVATEDGLLLLSRSDPTGDGEVTRRILHLSPHDTVQIGRSVMNRVAVVTYKSCGVIVSLPPLFASELVWASNGHRTAVVSGPEYSISVFDGKTLVAIVRRDIQPEVVTESVAAREVGTGERWGFGIGGPECVVPVDEVLEQRGYAGTVPLVEELAVAPSGTLWVKRRVPGSEERFIDIFDAIGQYLGTHSGGHAFPVEFLPGGRFATIEKDSLDLERLVVFGAEFGVDEMGIPVAQ